ncbi:ABC transporter substrate-binding protein [Actinoplanes subtropicus]|uniref:ABC transporter substrate-binding protein n=1 Tax=Actinoplanes subtropicus TaxID=543632 RepID=UPI0004C38D68|nr:extracellular solute-binding protein [Actinoplanes subtropicus]
MRRTFAVLGAAALATAAALSACTVKDDSTGSASGKQITFLTFETPNLTPQYWDAAIKRVTDQHPDISVKRLTSPTQDRTAYAKQLLQSGQFPDVMIAVSPAGFAEAGDLYAWTDQELASFQYPHNGAVNGKVYQLPANTQTIPITYYNKDLFTKAGITAPPATYQQMMDDAAKLKAKNITPFVTGGVHDSIGPLVAGVWGTDVYAKNPDWMHQRRAGTVKFCDPDPKKALGKIADLAAKGYLDKAGVSRDYAGAQQAFLDGKGAMYAMGNWLAGSLDGADKPKFAVGQFNWPGDADNRTVPAFTGGGLLVNAKAKNLDAARTFALAFQLDKTNLDNSAVTDGLIPAIKGYTPPATVGPAYKAGYDLYAKAAQDQTVVPAFNFEAGDDAPLPGMGAKIDSSVVDLITGKKNADAVCSFLDSEWAKG